MGGRMKYKKREDEERRRRKMGWRIEGREKKLEGLGYLGREGTVLARDGLRQVGDLGLGWPDTSNKVQCNVE